jgi:glycosyltransferase involved in cell wall biosynthesis
MSKMSSARKPPKVSVVIAVHNCVAYLGAAITSALRQSLPAHEIIIVDDASDDGSTDLIAELARRHPRIQLIPLAHNMGPSTARNIALDAACGDWIAILDADDICLPNRFEAQVNFLQRTGVDLCGSWFIEFGQGVARSVRWPHTEPELRAAMLFQSAICHPTVMARREVFIRHRYKGDLRLAEDYDLFARAMSDFRLANVPELLLRYRRHTTQATQAKRGAMEKVTQGIRLELLSTQHIEATIREKQLHNLIRAPISIRSLRDLQDIERWLLKIAEHFDNQDARKIIASQWTRACIRAAPLGMGMHRLYRHSALRRIAENGLMQELDMAIIAALRLDYTSRTFFFLRRLGLSA